MLIRRGFVDGIKVWKWVEGMVGSLQPETWNGKPNTSRRECIWLGVGVNLGLKCSFFQGLEVPRGLRNRCNNLWGGEDWNSVLIYRYQRGVELKQHVDRDCFDPRVVLINVSQDDLLGGTVKFCYGENIETFSNGEVLEFNNRIKHGVKPVETERWSISIRKVNI